MGVTLISRPWISVTRIEIACWSWGNFILILLLVGLGNNSKPVESTCSKPVQSITLTEIVVPEMALHPSMLVASTVYSPEESA